MRYLDTWKAVGRQGNDVERTISKNRDSVGQLGWVSDDGERGWERMSSHRMTGREYRLLRRRQKVLSCEPPRLPEKGQSRTVLGPKMIGGYVSNSAVGRSSLLHPKISAVRVEKLRVVDMWRA